MGGGTDDVDVDGLEGGGGGDDDVSLGGDDDPEESSDVSSLGADEPNRLSMMINVWFHEDGVFSPRGG